MRVPGAADAAPDTISGLPSAQSVPKVLKAKTSRGTRPPTTSPSIGSTVPCMMRAPQRTSQRPTCVRRLMGARQASAPQPWT